MILVEIAATFRTNIKIQSPVLLRICHHLLQVARFDMAADSSSSSSSSSSSVASPRRALSISREKASVFILAEGEGDRNKQGAKPAEVYGFVGSISTIVATVLSGESEKTSMEERERENDYSLIFAALFFGWAYLPESWLYLIGITYYPSRYWAVAFPAYAMMLIIFVCVMYTSLNYIVTIPPNSWNSLCDEFTRAPVTLPSGNSFQSERPIDPISDIPITEVNLMMFGTR